MLLDYHIKVLLILELAIDGQVEPLEWLLNNGFPELGAFANAIRKDQIAYDWLMKNGYPDLAALTDAIEDNFEAYKWLKKHNRNFYIILSDAVQPKEYAMRYLKEHKLEVFTRLCMRIKQVKDKQADDAWDAHKATPIK